MIDSNGTLSLPRAFWRRPSLPHRHQDLIVIKIDAHSKVDSERLLSFDTNRGRFRDWLIGIARHYRGLHRQPMDAVANGDIERHDGREQATRFALDFDTAIPESLFESPKVKSMRWSDQWASGMIIPACRFAQDAAPIENIVG